MAAEMGRRGHLSEGAATHCGGIGHLGEELAAVTGLHSHGQHGGNGHVTESNSPRPSGTPPIEVLVILLGHLPVSAPG